MGTEKGLRPDGILPKSSVPNKRAIKQYDSHINIVIEDDKLQYLKQHDHSHKEFKPDRPDSAQKADAVSLMLMQ